MKQLCVYFFEDAQGRLVHSLEDPGPRIDLTKNKGTLGPPSAAQLSSEAFHNSLECLVYSSMFCILVDMIIVRRDWPGL